jgi:hypothetical protein
MRYSSYRVRAVIQYIPELDEDTPNRTWSAAEQQMLLLYGSSDEERRISEQEILGFCREHSAKSPYRSKSEAEQYLRSFQYIAAPLLRRQDITIVQHDYYFVSGIPSAIKNYFILRVPESQRTRSNPIRLADTLDILYCYFDPDALFLDLWNALGDFSEPAEPLSPSTVHHTSLLRSITDRVSEFCWALAELNHLAARQDVDQASVADLARGIQAELEQCLTSASCGYVGLQISSHISYNVNDSGSVSEMGVDVLKPIDPWMTSTEINDDYERYLADEYDNIELRFSDTSQVSDSGDIIESDSSSIFDSVTEFEAES